MEPALIAVGLPVKCRKCGKKGFVKPRTDYGGWYKSRLLRRTTRKWFCPEHAEKGEKMDKNFYERYKTPEPVESTEEELYKLLD